MRRLLTFAVSAFLVAVAFTLAAPPDLDPDPAVTTTVSEETFLVSRFFHCPWALANDRNDSTYSLMTAVGTDFAMSFPENGEVESGRSGGAPIGSAQGIPNERVLGVRGACTWTPRRRHAGTARPPSKDTRSPDFVSPSS